MSAKPLVYLAGPIAGATSEMLSWRERVAPFLRDLGYWCLSPMRGKDDLLPTAGERIPAEFHEYAHTGPFRTAEGIMQRDFADVSRAAVILANLSGMSPEAPSYGTMMELAWAYQLRKPVVAVVQPDSFVFSHPMLSVAVGPFQARTLDEAVHFIDLVVGG